jgi:hypothetical protein
VEESRLSYMLRELEESQEEKSLLVELLATWSN